MSARSKTIAFVVACHPGPTAVVTAIAALLSVSVGYTPWRTLLLAAAVLCGQLSIGWCNDWLDAGRDAAASRADKPTARGEIRARSVGIAAFLAAAATIPLSAALGPWAGGAHLIGAAAGWAYNLGLKNTPASVVPYLVFFGLLPAVVTLGAPVPQPPAVWALIAGALLGAAAHFANVLPDLTADERTGVRGLPHLLDRRVAGSTAFGLLVAAAVVIAVGTAGSGSIAVWIGLGIAVGLALTGVVLVFRRPATRLLMRLVMAAALVDVAMLLFAGAAISASR